MRFRWPQRAALGWIVALAAAAALQVWLRLQITQLGYELGTICKAAQRLGAEKAELEAELAAVTSPRALDLAARTRLRMRPAESGEIVGLP